MSNQTAAPTSTASLGKIRSPGAIVALNVVTLGLYSVYWWYSVNKELRDFGRSRNTTALAVRPILSTLAFGLGACFVVPYVWTAITTNQRIEKARRVVGVAHGQPAWVAPWLLAAAVLIANVAGLMTGTALVALLVASAATELAACTYMQVALNAVWRSEGAVPTRPSRPGGRIVGRSPIPILPTIC